MSGGTPVVGSPRTPGVPTTARLLPTFALLAAVAVGCAGSAPDEGVASSAPHSAVASPAPHHALTEEAAVQAGAETLRYGDHPETVLDLHRPTSDASGLTVVLVHGGFWREQYRRDLMDPLVPSLLGDGHLVANVEYRRVGGEGGWPTTFTDVAAALDALAEVEGVDPGRVVTVGHSAGGHLAVWAAARHRLPAGAPGADPVVRPCHAVSQAGVVVLDAAVQARLGDGAVTDLLGGDDPRRLRMADPSAWLPLGVPVTAVHAPDDDLVPLAQSERWVELATAAGDPTELVTAPGGHFSVIDPDHTLWQEVLARLRDVC